MQLPVIVLFAVCGLVARSVPVRHSGQQREAQDIAKALDLIFDSIELTSPPAMVNVQSVDADDTREPSHHRRLTSTRDVKSPPVAQRRGKAGSRRLTKSSLPKGTPRSPHKGAPGKQPSRETPVRPPKDVPERMATGSIILATMACTLLGAYLAYLLGRLIYYSMSRPGRGYITIHSDAENARTVRIPTLGKIREDTSGAITKGRDRLKEAVKPAAVASSSRR